MLTDNHPKEVWIEWAGNSNIVQHAMDRPWFYAEPPIFATEAYQPPCRCKTAVKLNRYPIEDSAGYVYIGQCERCQTIIWSHLECSGK